MLGKKRGQGVRKSFFSRTTALIGAAAAAAWLPTAALAQDETDPADQEEEEIVVTGTRVVRPDYAYSNPVTSVSSEALEYSGVVNATEFLQSLPALTNSFDSNDASGANAFIGGTGLNLLNLRNLGVDRTLVLVDGRRHVASLPGSAAVDVATIPLELIERVDISTGGASAIYGADGVSGVVNFVLRDDYDGLGIRAQESWTDAGGAGDRLISAIWGINTDGGRANLTLAAEYTHEGWLEMAERDFTSAAGWTDFFENPADLIDGDDDPDIPDFLPLRDIRIGILNVGGGFDTNFDGYPDFDGFGDPWISGTSVDSNGTFEQGGSGVPVQNIFGDILPEVDRYALNGMFHYDISNRMRFFTEVKYVNTQSFSLGQATFDQLLAVDLDNPFMPASIAADAAGNGLPFALFNRINNDLGLRGEEITRETFRAVIGLEGDLWDNFRYEMSLVHGSTYSENLAHGNRWNDRFAAAIDVVDVDAGPGVDLRCRIDVFGYTPGGGFAGASDWNYTDPFDLGIAMPTPGSFTPGPNSGCVPLNIFGEGSASQEAIDWITVDTRSTSLIQQTVFQAYLSGNLDSWFRLPGGSVGVAAGVELRNESSEADFDPRDQSGLTFGNAIANNSGDFDVGEVFAEVSLPILENRPFFDSLALDAAVRLSDYSTVGETTAWKVGLVWAPIEDITFRSTVAEAVRAPNIGELFDPGGQTFANLADPCDIDDVDEGSATREANCATILNALGVDPTTFQDPNNSGVEGILAGNETLTVETAETFTLGVILRPRFLPGFVFSADYYDIELTDAINTLDPQDIVNQCVDAPTIVNNFCNLVQRNPTTGALNFFIQRPENVAAFTTSGIDFSAAYTYQTDNLGSFGVRLVGNHLEDLSFTNLPGIAPDPDHEEGGAPEWQAVLDLTWQGGPLTVNYGLNYFSETRRFSAAQEAVEPDTVESHYFWYNERLTHDVQVRYSFTDAFTIYGGVINLGDQQPDFGETYYPVGAEGRTFYVGLNASLN